MVNWARRVVDNGCFSAFIVGVILVNAVVVGLETSEDLVGRYALFFQGQAKP